MSEFPEPEELLDESLFDDEFEELLVLFDDELDDVPVFLFDDELVEVLVLFEVDDVFVLFDEDELVDVDGLVGELVVDDGLVGELVVADGLVGELVVDDGLVGELGDVDGLVLVDVLVEFPFTELEELDDEFLITFEEPLPDEVEVDVPLTTFPELDVVTLLPVPVVVEVTLPDDVVVDVTLLLVDELVAPPRGLLELDDDELVELPVGLLELDDDEELVEDDGFLVVVVVGALVGFLTGVFLNPLSKALILNLASASFAGELPTTTPVIVAKVVAKPTVFSNFFLEFLLSFALPVSLPMHFSSLKT